MRKRIDTLYWHQSHSNQHNLLYHQSLIGCGRNHKIGAKIALHLPCFRRFAFIELLDPTGIQLFRTPSLAAVLHI